MQFCSSCLSCWRCSTCVFLSCSCRFMCSTSCVVAMGTVCLGFVSQLIKHPHNVPTVCGAVFTHYTLARRLLERNIFLSVMQSLCATLTSMTELVMLQGLGWRLTKQEFLHSLRWDYVVGYLIEGLFFVSLLSASCKCVVQLITMQFNTRPLTIRLNSSD